MDNHIIIICNIICLLGLFVIFLSYFGFPFLLLLAGYINKAVFGNNKKDFTTQLPTVQVIVSCYNEENIIENRIRNIQNLDYPSGRLFVLIISDGSTDKSNEIVANISAHDNRVKLFSIESNIGKNSAINLAFSSGEFTGDLLCFTDADTSFAPGTLLSGVKAFSDSQVGLVGGNLTYWLNQGGANLAEGMYWRLENFIRESEGNLGLLVCCPGQLIIMRRELFRPLPTDANTDFALPLSVLTQGYQTKFAVNAVARSIFPQNQKDVYKRRSRTIIRALTTINIFIKELPWKIRLILFLHKSVRFYTIFILFAIFFSNIISVLLSDNFIMRTLLSLQIIFYLTAVLGLFFEIFERSIPIFTYPYQFILQNLVASGAIISYFRGTRISKWQPPR